MVEYTWEILSLYTIPSQDGLENVVKRVNWRYQATESIYVADVYGLTELSSPSPDAYIAYNDLDDATVIGWLGQYINLDDLKAQVNARLADVKNPPITELDPPWPTAPRLTGEEEYLVVFNNNPSELTNVWGPLKWSSAKINAKLANENVDRTLPEDIIMYRKNILPVNQPLTVTDSVKIYRAEYTPQPEFDPLFQTRSNLTWVTDSGRAIGTYFLSDKDIDGVKLALKSRVNETKISRQAAGFDDTIQGQTVSIDTGIPYRLNLIEKYLSINEGEMTVWGIGDYWFEFSRDDLKNLIGAIDGYLHSHEAWAKEKIEEINAATTIEQLKAIDLTD